VGPLILYLDRTSSQLFIPDVLSQRNKRLDESYSPVPSGSDEISDHFPGDPWINL